MAARSLAGIAGGEEGAPCWERQENGHSHHPRVRFLLRAAAARKHIRINCISAPTRLVLTMVAEIVLWMSLLMIFAVDLADSRYRAASRWDKDLSIRYLNQHYAVRKKLKRICTVAIAIFLLRELYFWFRMEGAVLPYLTADGITWAVFLMRKVTLFAVCFFFLFFPIRFDALFRWSYCFRLARRYSLHPDVHEEAQRLFDDLRTNAPVVLSPRQLPRLGESPKPNKRS